jgi:hypothetical protein
VRVLRRLPARWIGECRRRAPTAHPSASAVLGKMARGVGGGGEAAGGVHLALSCLVRREVPPPFRVLLRRAPARARLLQFRFGCAAQRSVTRRYSGRPRRRRAAAAPRWRRSRHCPRQSAAACTCTADGGGDSAGALRRFAASGNGAPPVVGLGVHVGAGCDERTDDSAIAVGRRIVQRGVAKAVHGGGGVRWWAPRGTPVPNRYPNTKQQARPEGRPRFRFGVDVNGKRYSGRTRRTRHLAPRSRIHQTWPTSESRGNGDCGRRRRREIVRLGNIAGERTSHGTWRRDRHGRAPACSIKIA